MALFLVSLTGCEWIDPKSVNTGDQLEGNEYGIYKILTLPDLASGTGFLINNKNVVATNRHVVTSETTDGRVVVAPSIKIVYFSKGKFELVEAEVIKIPTGAQEDLALLRPQRTLPGKPVTLGDYAPQVGVDVKAIGFPGAADIDFKRRVQEAARKDPRFAAAKTDVDKFIVYIDIYLQTMARQYRDNPAQFSATQSQGVVQKLAPYDNVPVVQHQAPVNPGNSGGPLFDVCGNVVGINTFLPRGSQGIFMSLGSPWVAEQIKAAGHEVQTSSRCLTARLGNFAPYAFVGAPLSAALLATLSMLFFFRKSPAVQRGYTMITRVGRPVGGAGGGQSTRVAAPGGAAAGRAGRGGVDATVMPGASVLHPAGGGGGGELKLVPVNGGAALSIGLDRLQRGATIGRDSGNDLVVQEKTISKRHARLTLDRDNRLVVEDSSSANGTFKGRSKITRDTFGRGDTVKFGSAEYRVELPGGGGGAAAGTVAATVMQAQAQPERALMMSGMDPDGRPVQLTLRAAGEKSWTIGRKAGAVDLVLNSPRVSSEHARVRYRPGRGFEIADLKSANGTRVDGTPVASDFVSIDAARTISFGDFKLDISKG